MRILALATITLLPAAVGAAAAPNIGSPPRDQSAAPAPRCGGPTTSVAVERGHKLAPRKLNELPPANVYAAVYRVVGGCESPIVVRYDVGRQ